MEFLNHFFGTCGEAHPNIFTLTLLTSIIFYGFRHKFYKGREN
jgi:hypothetical protein